MSAPDAPSPSPPNASTVPRLRVDDVSVAIVRPGNLGARLEIRPQRIVTAANDLVLPVFDGWLAAADFVVTIHGACAEAFTAALDFGKNPLGTPVTATVGEAANGPFHPFSMTLSVPLRSLRPQLGTAFVLGLVLSPGNRTLPLVKTTLLSIAAKGPEIASLDLLEATDSALFDGTERRLFDLQNPEEGLWLGTGRWRLRLCAEWAQGGEGFSLDPRPAHLGHAFAADGAAGALVEDATRRAGSGARTETELLLDTAHPALLPVPQEGKDVPLDVAVEHTLTFGGNTAALTWTAPLPIRVRDPLPLLKTFQRLSAVGIDFGTTSTVAALYQKGYRSLLRLGSAASAARKGAGPSAESAENPAYLLIEDHERLWAEMDRDPKTARFPNLLRVVRGSHAAYEARADAPNAVIGELKSLPERILNLDHSPQLRDRERQRDFLLDEARVRVLIRTYAYLLSRAINRPGQDVYLSYRLTHPAKVDERSRKLLEDEIRSGILLGIPQGIPAEEISVEMAASEPEAFAAEVCPELAAHPALEPLIAELGEMRFAVFDFGGGTLDIACGRFRPATPEEQDQFGSSTVIETLQVSGDDHLGGDHLTHELVWLAHQNEKHLPEMEEKEVPMMRPVTVPPNTLANKPFLYKRSLAGRQNRVRFERDLGIEAVKYGPEQKPKSAPALTAARLDGSEIALSTFGSDVGGLAKEMHEHLVARIRSGVKLMKSTLGNAAWGEGGDFRAQGVVILLAGNSSRSAFVERVLAEELGLGSKDAPFRVWRPEGDAPFQQVALYETPSRTERGVTIVGVTPKTAVALGALKIANNEVHLMRKAQGFSYFLGDLRGFPPKFTAAIPMGTSPGDPAQAGPHYVELGRWDTKTPLRVSKEYVPGKMTSNDPRVFLVPTGLPAGHIGRLFVCVTAPEEVAVHLERDGEEPLRTTLNLAKFMR